MADSRITGSTTDEELKRRALWLCSRFGGSLDQIGWILTLERRIALLEQSGVPAHLRDVEKR
jgi:hypothetical protein